MRWLHFLLTRLFRRSQLDCEMDEEIQFHIAARTEALEKTGLSPTEAQRTARLEFGAMERYKEAGREQRTFHFWHNLLADVRYGLRMMRRAPGFTVVAVLTLALGIGANSGMFGIVYGLLYRPLPYPDESRIAAVHLHFSPQNNPRGNLSLADFADWRAVNTVFEQVAIYSRSRFTLTGSNLAEQVAGAAVTADYFSVLRIQPVAGRTFQPGDDAPAAPAQIVISESLWQRRFGRAGDTIGRVIEVNGNPATIIGVVRGGYNFPLPNTELWQNVRLKVTRRGPFFFQGLGRLRPGMTLANAQAETNLIGRNIERANPSVYSNLTIPVEPLRDYLVGNLRPALFTMLAFVMAVLMIATANVANLLLVRGSTRIREMAVRLSLGAARRRLVQQLLTESVLLALAGAVVGSLLAYAGIRAFRAFNPADLPLTYQVQLDWTVLAFTVVVSVAAGIVFGLVPAFQSARGDLQTPLKEGSRTGSGSAGHHRIRSVLVVAEIAVSLVLLVSAGLLLRSFIRLQGVDVGINVKPESVLTMVVTPKATRNPMNPAADSPVTRAFYQQVLENLARLPGVQYAAISDSLPPDMESDDDTFSIAGRPWSDQEFPSTTLPRISPDYFRALGVPLLRGRFFTQDDTAESRPVVIISASLARRYFLDADPLGQKIQASQPSGNTSPFMEIVGVVGDVKYWGTEIDARPAYYVPFTQNLSPASFLVVRSAKPAASLAPVIEQEIHAVDKDAVVRRPLTMEDLLSESVAEPRFRTLLLTALGALAVMLAAIGIYGVIAYSVTQRTQEIGIRMALGAQRSHVLAMVMRRGALLVVVGLGIGLLGSLLVARALSRFLFAVGPGDPLAFAVAVILLACIGLAAALVPALRATKIDPLVALRYE